MKIISTRPVTRMALASALSMFASYSFANTVTATNGIATAELSINNDWGSGYCAEVAVNNTGNAVIDSWQVELNLNDSQVNNLWNGNLNGITVLPVGYNATIYPGNTVSFGFCGTGTEGNYLATLAELVLVGGQSSSSTTSSSSSTTTSSTGSSSGSGTTSSSTGSSTSGSTSNSTSNSTSSSTSSSSSSSSSSTGSSGGTVTSYSLQEATAGFCGVEGSIDSNNAGFTGAGFANTDNALGNGINYAIDAAETAVYQFHFVYANGATARSADLVVNGATVASLSFENTSSWVTWQSSDTLSIALQAGNNLVRLEASNSAGLPNVDFLQVEGASPGAGSCDGGDSSSSSSSTTTSSSGASSGSSSSSSGASSTSSSSTGTSSTTGSSTSSTSSTTSSTSTSSGSSSSSSGAVIPNAASNNFPYCRSADSDPDGDGWGWENSHSCIVHLSSADPGEGSYPYCVIGAEQLTLCASDNGSWGNENGAICLSQSMCPGMGSSNLGVMREDLVNANAGLSAQAVYDYLRSVWGSYTLSGQQDLTWQDGIDQYQRVLNDTGRAPAIMGYDFMNYGMWAGNPGLAQTEEGISHWQRGGLVTFAWHWRDPDASDSTIGEFYTDSTSFQIPILNGELDTTSASYANIAYDIGLIAAELQSLQDAGVPVLWRPLHEASGGWFWWGRSDRTDGVPAPYAQVVLWRHLYDQLTRVYGLNNLIWVWNGQSGSWYPGDEYVDIVSFDMYDGAQNYESQVSTFNLASGYAQQEKMIAMSENSNIPDPDLMLQDGATWLYFVVWNDVDTAEGETNSSNFWTGEYYNTNAHKNHVYNHARVITLDELPSF